MIYHQCLLLALAICGACSSLEPYRPLEKRAPVPPSQDPFYTPPPGYQNTAAGAILRYRTVPNNLNASVPNITTNLQTTYQIMFRTSDVFGNAAAAVTTLFVPSANPQPDKFMSYQIPADSPDADCCPSVSFVAGTQSSIPNQQSSALVLLMIAGLNKGWYINSPDHEGLKAAQNVVLIQGQTTLDSLRAILQSGSVSGISKQARSVIWGYSGGAVATLAAAELQAAYAPELNLVGSAAGGIGVNPTIGAAALASTSKYGTDRLANTFLGWANAYPNMTAYLNNQLVANTSSKFHTGMTQCNVGNTFKGTTLASYFKTPRTAVTAPVPQSLLTWAGGIGVRGTPKAPVYINEAIHDELVTIQQADDLVSRYCSAGANVQYLRDTVNNHVQEGIAGGAGELSFLEDRLNGVPFQSSCTTRNVTVSGVDCSGTSVHGAQICQAFRSIYSAVGGG